MDTETDRHADYRSHF